MVYFIESIVHNIGISERILLMLFSFLSTFFLLDLFYIILKINGKTKFPNLLSLIPALFYQYNLFTLSVTVPHILVWTLLIVSAPLIISFFTYTLFFGVNFKRMFLTLIFLFIFSSSISDDYLPFFLIVGLIFILIEAYYFIKSKSQRKNNGIKIVYSLIFVALAVVWSNVPLYFSTIYAAYKSRPSTYYIQFAKSESIHTTIINVLSLSGYSWLYGGPPYGPGAYPWYSYFYLLKLISIICIFVLIVSSIYVSMKNKGIRPLGIIAAVAVIFSTGTNYPFGIINESLLKLGGPFLFLVNPYYLVLQFYVLFLSALIFLLLLSIMEPLKDVYKNNRYKLNKKYKHFLKITVKIIVIVIIAVLLITNIYPFATDSIYQKNGNNIDMININNGLKNLGNYLEKSYSQPDYLSLLIPLSSRSGSDRLLYNNNNGTFIDSVGLIQSFDPYPLIYMDNTNLSTVIENYMSGDNFQSMNMVMQYFHIKYIIYTNCFPAKYTYMDRSPDGRLYNMSMIYSNLIKNFGEPKIFGVYFLFTVKNVNPIISIINNPLFINSTFSQYINFMAGLNESALNSSLTNIIENTFPSSSNINTYIYKYSPYRYIYPAGKYDKMLVVTENSTIRSSNLNSTINVNGDNELMLKPKPILSYSNKSIPNNYKLQTNITSPELLNLSLKPSLSGKGDKIYMESNFGNINVNLSIYNRTSYFDFNISANYHGKPVYAWDNIILPRNITKFNISLFYEENNALTVKIYNSHNHFYNTSTFYYGPNNYYNDRGYCPVYMISNNPVNISSTFSIHSGSPFQLDTLNLYSVMPIEYILFYPTNTIPVDNKDSVSITSFGNYKVNGYVTNTSYLYTFDLPNMPWYVSLNENEYKPLYQDFPVLLFNISNVMAKTYCISLYTQSLTEPSFYASLVIIISVGLMAIGEYYSRKYHFKK